MFVLSAHSRTRPSPRRAELVYSTPTFPTVTNVRQLSLTRLSPPTIHFNSPSQEHSVELCIVTMHSDPPDFVHTAFHVLERAVSSGKRLYIYSVPLRPFRPSQVSFCLSSSKRVKIVYVYIYFGICIAPAPVINIMIKCLYI
uniref:Usp domain-containing protein n=1 Tax=Hydatigena taeniaeformis TaxID=6205 RepID=A0A0R3WP17_HYDTA